MKKKNTPVLLISPLIAKGNNLKYFEEEGREHTHKKRISNIFNSVFTKITDLLNKIIEFYYP